MTQQYDACFDVAAGSKGTDEGGLLFLHHTIIDIDAEVNVSKVNVTCPVRERS